jgi:hypothetical protein
MNQTVVATCAVVCIGLLEIAGREPAPPIAPAPRAVDVAALVQQLSSPRFDDREAATKRLGNLPVEAPPPELLEAMKSPNREVRRRAADAVKAIKLHAQERSLGRERTFAKRGKIDRFVASAAAWDVPANDMKLWQAVLDVALDVSKRANYYWTPTNSRSRITPKDFWPSPLFRKSNGRYIIPSGNNGGQAVRCSPGGYIARTVVAHNITRSALVVVEEATVERGIDTSIILANGDVCCTDGTLATAIIFCDGDVDIAERVINSVVIAHGNIRIGSFPSRSILIAGGKVTIAKPDKRVEKNPELANKIQENSRHPLGFVSFFELSDVGVEVESADGGLRVSNLVAGGPMAAAGVQERDVITKVGEHAVKTAEELRRRLRDASAVKGEAVLTIRRGAATLRRRVTIPD